MNFISAQGPNRVGLQNERHADGQDGARLPSGHRPLQPRSLELPLVVFYCRIGVLCGLTFSLFLVFFFVRRRKRSFQPFRGRGAEGKSLRLFGVVHQAEIPRPAGQVGVEADQYQISLIENMCVLIL